GLLPEPLIFTLETVGGVPPVSNTKPAGALRIMVPVPTSPALFSLYIGPVSAVKAPEAAPSAEMALPPVASVNWGWVTAMPGLVLGVLLPSVRSLTVRVKMPVAFNETVVLAVPAAKAVGAGKLAVESLELKPTVSLAVLTRFQNASTALTVTGNGMPANWPLG